MKNFEVIYTVAGSVSVIVSAENEDEAREKARMPAGVEVAEVDKMLGERGSSVSLIEADYCWDVIERPDITETE